MKYMWYKKGRHICLGDHLQCIGYLKLTIQLCNSSLPALEHFCIYFNAIDVNSNLVNFEHLWNILALMIIPFSSAIQEKWHENGRTKSKEGGIAGVLILLFCMMEGPLWLVVRWSIFQQFAKYWAYSPANLILIGNFKPNCVWSMPVVFFYHVSQTTSILLCRQNFLQCLIENSKCLGKTFIYLCAFRGEMGEGQTTRRLAVR